MLMTFSNSDYERENFMVLALCAGIVDAAAMSTRFLQKTV
jgi:uncharacterized membrane protein YoaK (UPF0700 family)